MNENLQKDLESLELKIAYFLRFGVLLAGALLLFGLITNPGNLTQYETYQEFNFLSHIKELIEAQNYYSLISYSGLMILILLPVLRILMTLLLFLKEKDYIMSFINLSVFLMLVASFFLDFI